MLINCRGSRGRRGQGAGGRGPSSLPGEGLGGGGRRRRVAAGTGTGTGTEGGGAADFGSLTAWSIARPFVFVRLREITLSPGPWLQLGLNSTPL